MIRTARFGTRDLPRAREFYDAVTAPLGGKRVLDRDELSGYQAASGGLFIIGKPLAGDASVGNGTQIVFDAADSAAVDAAHAKAIELGGACEGPPGWRSPAFYAAYFRDLDGNKLVAAHFRAA